MKILLFKIKYSSGKTISFDEDQIIHGITKINTDDMFYLQRIFEDSYSGLLSEKGSAIATVDPYLGIGGLLAQIDYFRIGKDETLYKTSSIESITIE